MPSVVVKSSWPCDRQHAGLEGIALVGHTVRFCLMAKGVPVSVLSCVQLFASPWTVVHQAPLFMEFSRREYCSVLPCPPPRALPNPGTKPVFLMSPSLAGGFFTVLPGKPTDF